MLTGTGGPLGFLCTESAGVGVYSAGGGRREKIGDCEQSNGRISLRKQPTLYFWLAENDSTNEKRYPDLGTDTSSVWNFCTRFSNVISRGNQWWRREMSAVFSGYGKKRTVNSLNITWLGGNYAGEYHQLALRSESYLAWLISKDPLLQKKNQLLFTMHIYNATMWPS